MRSVDSDYIETRTYSYPAGQNCRFGRRYPRYQIRRYRVEWLEDLSLAVSILRAVRGHLRPVIFDGQTKGLDSILMRFCRILPLADGVTMLQI